MLNYAFSNRRDHVKCHDFLKHLYRCRLTSFSLERQANTQKGLLSFISVSNDQRAETVQLRVVTFKQDPSSNLSVPFG